MKKNLMFGAVAVAVAIILGGCSSSNAANEPTGTVTKMGTINDIQQDINETMSLAEELGSSFDALKEIFDDHGVRLGKSLSTNHGLRNCESGSITVTEQNGTKFVSVDKCQVKDIEADGDFSYKRTSTESDTGSIKSISFVLPDDAYIKATDNENKVYANNVNVTYNSTNNYTSDDNDTAELKFSADSAGIKVESDTVDFKNIKFSVEVASNIETYNLSGMFQINNKGWLAVDTPEEFKRNYDEKCPYDGTLTITGKEHVLKFEAQNDQSVKVYYDDEEIKTYDSCEDIFKKQ